MKINDAVARLVRAGDENSAMWRKIHDALDEIAKTLAKYFLGGGTTNCIARYDGVGVWFKHWPTGEYEISMGLITLCKSFTRNSKPREVVLEFCRLVAQQGLLDKISERLEEQTKKLVEGHEAITHFSQKHDYFDQE